MNRLWMISLLGVTSLAQVAIAEDPDAAPDEAGLEEAIRMVRQLGDEEFANRERATTRLIEIGVPALPAVEQGTEHPDREIRYRCQRILGIVGELDFQRRLAAFAAGRGDGRDLPGWERFAKLFGDDGDSRAMFVEMQAAESELMRAVQEGPRGVASAVESRCKKLQETQRSLGRSISLGSLLSLLFAVLDEEVNISMQTSSQLSSFCYQSTLTDALRDPEKEGFIRKILGSWIQRSQGWEAYQTMTLAMRMGFPEGLVPARQALMNPGEQPFVRQMAILTVAKLGNEDHVAWLEGALNDTARCSAQRVNNVTFETQLRDVALAAILILQKRDPKQFGFERIQRNDQTVFVTGSVGFENEDRRKKVFSKYDSEKSPASAPPDTHE